MQFSNTHDSTDFANVFGKKYWENNKIGAIVSGDILNTRAIMFIHNVIVEKGGAVTQKHHMVETRSANNFESTLSLNPIVKPAKFTIVIEFRISPPTKEET